MDFMAVLNVFLYMKRIAKYILLSLTSLLLLVGAILFWPFTIAGVITCTLSRGEFNRWISSFTALGLTVCWRLVTGSWFVRIGSSSNLWYVEVFQILVSWSITAILVATIVQSIFKIINDFRSRSGFYQFSS